MKLLIFCLPLLATATLLGGSPKVLSRDKRYLIWFEGVNWVQLVVGIGIPMEVQDHSITIGTAAKAFYLLPTNASDYTHPSIDYARKKRSATRWIIYSLIENFFEKSGYGNGKACLLRTICEAAAKPFDKKSGILAEIVHAVLTPSSTHEILDDHSNNQYYAAENFGRTLTDCESLFQECPLDFIDQFAKFLK